MERWLSLCTQRALSSLAPHPPTAMDPALTVDLVSVEDGAFKFILEESSSELEGALHALMERVRAAVASVPAPDVTALKFSERLAEYDKALDAALLEVLGDAEVEGDSSPDGPWYRLDDTPFDVRFHFVTNSQYDPKYDKWDPLEGTTFELHVRPAEEVA